MKFKPVIPAVILSAAACVTIVALKACAQAPLRNPAAAAAAAPTPAAQPISPEDEAEGRAELAERFYALAMNIASGTQASHAALDASSALLEAAAKMNPDEPRYLRMLAMERERNGDVKGAINTWNRYRQIPAVAEDRVAQCEVIELYLGQLQSNDAKIKYIRDVLAKPTLDDQVKAHIAAIAVQLLDQRSRSEALVMLGEARKYYPLPEVTLLELAMLPPNATTVQRFDALLNVVRANPANASAVAEIADMLSAAGLSEQALTWYAVLMDIHIGNETGPAISSIVNYLAERYKAGEGPVAVEQLDRELQKVPDDAEFWQLRLTIQRGDESAQLLRQAQQVFGRHVDDLCDQIAQGAPAGPATAPAPAASPETQPALGLAPPEKVASAIARLRQLPNPAVRAALTDALANQAWFELYYDRKPELAGPAIAALQLLLKPDDFLLRRLEGWHALVSSNEAGARQIFTAQQKIDPLCMLGLFQLEDKAGHAKETATLGAELLSTPYKGVLGAILYQATKGKGLKPARVPPETALLTQSLANFPSDCLMVTRYPFKFYSLRAEPIKLGLRLGEPFLVVMTIENKSRMDITIGEAGLIKPTLCISAQLRGAQVVSFPGVAIDRIMGRFVLRPGEAVNQVVRIDQGSLGNLVRMNAGGTMLINGDIVANADVARPLKPRAGGSYKTFSKMLTRLPGPLNRDDLRRKFFAALDSGAPREKMLDMELLASYYGQFAAPTATPAMKTYAEQYLQNIDNQRTKEKDVFPESRTWANYLYAALTAGNVESRAVNDMLNSDAWETRLLGLVITYEQPEIGKPHLEKAAKNDPDPIVRAYAKAGLELAKIAATKPPVQPVAIPATTQPFITPAVVEPTTLPSPQ